MRIKYKQVWARWFPLFLFALMVCWHGQLEGKETDGSFQIVILPFDVGSSGRYDYLSSSLDNMLSSRLAAAVTGIHELDYLSYEKKLKDFKGASGRETVQDILQRLGIDYLISGTMYSLQESLRLELTIYPSGTDKAVQKLTAVAQDAQGIISAVNDLSSDISRNVFGLKQELEVKESGKGKEGLIGFETAHPERIFKKGVYSSETMVKGQASSLITSQNIRRSPALSLEIVAMDVADLNGDGKDEIVACSKNEIRLYHYETDGFREIGKIPLSVRLKVHALNLVDIDNDNVKEIIVSASNKYRPSSMIIEWRGVDSFGFQAKDIPFYLRPVKVDDGGMVLVGQQGISDITEEERVVRAGLYRLRMENNNLHIDSKLSVPDSVNLFDFLYVDLNGDNVSELIVIDSREKLLVYSHDQKLLSVSEKEYGGSFNHFGPPLIEDKEGIGRNLTYVPTRLIAVDINKDDIPEIIVGRNQPSSLSDYRLLPNSREYENGYMACLSWNGTSMTELWRTNLLEGYVADYQFDSGTVDPIDGNGRPEISAKLWVAQAKEDSFMDLFSAKNSGSRIYEYQFNFSGENSDDHGE